MVKVKNRSNGVVSEFTDKQWNEIKDDPKWARTFTVEEPKKKPVEAQKLEAEKSSKKVEKNDDK